MNNVRCCKQKLSKDGFVKFEINGIGDGGKDKHSLTNAVESSYFKEITKPEKYFKLSKIR